MTEEVIKEGGIVVFFYHFSASASPVDYLQTEVKDGCF
jgi:hypothetical protein